MMSSARACPATRRPNASEADGLKCSLARACCRASSAARFVTYFASKDPHSCGRADDELMEQPHFSKGITSAAIRRSLQKYGGYWTREADLSEKYEWHHTLC